MLRWASRRPNEVELVDGEFWFITAYLADASSPESPPGVSDASRRLPAARERHVHAKEPVMPLRAKRAIGTGDGSSRTPDSRVAHSATASPPMTRPRTLLMMSSPYNPNIDMHVGRGAGLYLQINGRSVDNAYGAIVMAELAVLRDEFPAVRVDVTYRKPHAPDARRHGPPDRHGA